MSERVEILELLRHHGHGMSQRVLADMYQDPFWGERFGGRGRRHADEDSDFHLKYLSRALQHGDPGVLVRYARWLREVLATRGMCTRHLAENFRRLAEAIDAMGWPDGSEASSYVRAAEAALVYPDGPERAVQEVANALAAEAESAFRARCPQGWVHDAARGPRVLHEDLLNYISYLADALAMGRADTLVAHTSWFAGYLEGRGTPREELDLVIRSLSQALQARGDAPETTAYLEAALAAPSRASREPETPWTPKHLPETRSTP